MNTTQTSTSDTKWAWLYDLLLVVVLVTAAYFRFVGASWGAFLNQHPDENFISSVTYGIQPVGTSRDQLGAPPSAAAQSWRSDFPKAFPDCKSWGGYFSTACSPLNPNNRGYSFYVYGDLPIFMVRYLDEWLGQLSQIHFFGHLIPGLAGLANNLTLLGRYFSGLMDLGTITLLYFIVKRVYGVRAALLAAAFSAFAVEQIQQSHFYTTDNFTVFFMFLTLFFAVLIASGAGSRAPEPEPASTGPKFVRSLERFARNPLTLLSAAFGVALGMAAASKVNAAALAVTFPVALVVRYYRPGSDQAAGGEGDRPTFGDFLAKNYIYMLVGALVSVLSFRLFQPYAFSGLGLNPQWVANLRDYFNQASPNSDLPWALQWARRTHLYSFQNLTEWGLGLPLGILAWAGFLWMGWRILRGEWRQHLLLWSWTAVYFVWQSLQWNPTMRYQLPIYPLLAMMAAWLVVRLWDTGRRVQGQRGLVLTPGSRLSPFRIGAVSLGGLVLVLTGAWAFSFTRIYTRPEPRAAASDWIFQNVPGPINLRIQAADGSTYLEPLPFPYDGSITSSTPYTVPFVAHASGTLSKVLLGHVMDTSTPLFSQRLSMLIASGPEANPDQILGRASLNAAFDPGMDGRGKPFTLTFSSPISIQQGQTYYLHFATSGGELKPSGAAVVNETDYDYPLPFRNGFYDPFGGIYRGDLNLQVYWDDNADKLARFTSILDQGDYLFLPTAHQVSQITRIPERYPLTTAYYRQLLGCPADKDILWCYQVAEPGMFHGSLGFDLVAVFTSYPNIGPWQINDQSAEEAFTFYDHPKVMIFKKSAAYDPARVRAILGAVDTSTAVHLIPGQVNSYKNLMLPADKLAEQQAGGTWSELFNRAAFFNRYPGLGVMFWYLVIFVLGLAAYPLVRAALPGLADHGYPLARIVGLLLWAWFAWMAGSVGFTYSKLTIAICLGLVVLLGIWLAWRQRDELAQELKTRWRYFLLVEAVFLSFFLVDLLIRFGNPDLWHPAKGGERPMDFAYLNAILKSTSFPPYDPWFAGGYINYYYYGYVIVGTPVKLLGIVPSIAYNFILPTLYACVAVAAFSVVWNLLYRGWTAEDEDGHLVFDKWSSLVRNPAFIGGLSASAAMVLLGNLGVVRMLYQGFQQVAAPGGLTDKANIFQRIVWAVKGFFMTLGGVHLPYGPGDWYWFPSRALPDSSGSPITEFPLFTFIYSDLHAHMIALMITVLAVAWALSVLMAKARWKNHLDTVLGLLLGGLVIGALKPTNTWDYYTYQILGAVVLTYAIWRYADVSRLRLSIPDWSKRLLLVIGANVVLVGAALLFYQPFTHWFLLDPSYTKVSAWKGGRSNISSYLVHWGVFLFFIVSWLTWETRQWLAATPVSALRKLRPYRDLIFGTLFLIVLVLVAQQVWVMQPTQDTPWKGITILWIAIPLAVWAAVLLFRPGNSDVKRLILFMIGTGLLLTMVVEMIVMGGDIGRMNTVFKIYNQAWVLLGLGAAASFGWLVTEFRKWLPGWRAAWQIAAVALTAGAGLFLLMGGLGKIQDRMAEKAPHTLDSMTYMNYATYFDFDMNMDLSEDYRAILWLQDNVKGSPVIAEAAPAGVQYRWLGRISIYTGLPDVVGWEWHQIQQRVMFQETVKARGLEEDTFYMTTDVNMARDFLKKYNVRYIIVGQQERAKYVGDGLTKFEAYNGIFWNQVYRDGQTVIYAVLPQGQVNP